MHPEKGRIVGTVLRAENRFLRAAVIFLAIGFVCQSVLIYFVVSRDTTRIVPAVVTRSYEISAAGGNSEYLSDMADYVLIRLFTVNPATVDYAVEQILKIVDPQHYAALRTNLDVMRERLKQESISTVFSPSGASAVPSQNLVFVRGKLNTYIADKLVSETAKEYEVKFIFRSTGRLYVSSIREVIRSAEGHVVEYK